MKNPGELFPGAESHCMNAFWNTVIRVLLRIRNQA